MSFPANMVVIRKLFRNDQTLVTYRWLSNADAERVGDIVAQEAYRLVVSTGLTDTALNLPTVADEIAAGARNLRDTTAEARLDGLDRFTRALDQYAARFGNTGSEPVR